MQLHLAPVYTCSLCLPAGVVTYTLKLCQAWPIMHAGMVSIGQDGIQAEALEAQQPSQ